MRRLTHHAAFHLSRVHIPAARRHRPGLRRRVMEPELQTAAWELIRHIEERPHGKTIQEVVTTIREAIQTDWQEHSAPMANGKNGTTPHRPLHRPSDDLGCFSRWSRRIDSWDPQAIALGDDELALRRHLKAARALRTFCEAFYISP